jgi:hypothetical protein
MPRPLFDSEYLYGLHDPGGEGIMLDAGRPGWILFTMEIGANPADGGGFDFRPWSNRNLGVLCRLNNGYYPNGTIPVSSHYADFARRAANFVAASPGCKLWIIGNEMNFAMERPRIPTAAPSLALPPERAIVEPMPAPAPEPPENADPMHHGDPSRFNALGPEGGAWFHRGAAPNAEMAAEAGPATASAATADGFEVITPDLYVSCYRQCRAAIKAVPGHADDQVLVGATAPWNNQTSYPGNPTGDWVQYHRDILLKLGPGACDGFAVHTYTHGTDPQLVTSDQMMDPPFQNRHYQFKAYLDFMNAVPLNMRGLAAYVTETDQNDPWADTNSGWVQRAYAEINRWNQQPGAQQLRALVLYRWPRLDRWYIDGKGGVIDDFRAAIGQGYTWHAGGGPTPPPPPPPPPPPVSGAWRPGATLATTERVNLRRTPGYRNKPAGDVITQVPPAQALTLLAGGPQAVDSLTWWPVRYEPSPGQRSQGWMAQSGPDGTRYLVKTADAPPFTVGEAVMNVSGHTVNLRRSPGYRNKPANDVLAGVPSGATLTVLGGPQNVDGLTWWSVRYVASGGGTTEGWMADAGPDGQVYLASTAYLM